MEEAVRSLQKPPLRQLRFSAPGSGCRSVLSSHNYFCPTAACTGLGPLVRRAVIRLVDWRAKRKRRCTTRIKSRRSRITASSGRIFPHEARQHYRTNIKAARRASQHQKHQHQHLHRYRYQCPYLHPSHSGSHHGSGDRVWYDHYDSSDMVIMITVLAYDKARRRQWL